jgi:hypothetical protein
LFGVEIGTGTGIALTEQAHHTHHSDHTHTCACEVTMVPRRARHGVAFTVTKKSVIQLPCLA